MKTNKLQCCYISLSDGSTHTFVGEAVFEEGEKRSITKIRFGKAEVLPNGCTWETIEGLEKEEK